MASSSSMSTAVALAEQCSQRLSFISVWIWLDFFRQLINGKTDRILSCWGSDLHCPAHLWSASSIRMWIEVKLGWGKLQEHSNAGSNHCVGEGDGDGGGGGREAVWIEGDGVGGKWVQYNGSSLLLMPETRCPNYLCYIQLKGKQGKALVYNRRSTAGFSYSL